MLPKSSNRSAGCPSKERELDLVSRLSICDDGEQGMEVLASAITVAGTGVQASKITKECYHDYRDAKKQTSYAQHHCQQLRLNLEQLNQLSSSNIRRIGPAQASLKDIRAALPTVSQATRKKDRLKWVISRKAEFEREIAQNSQIESSATLGLLVSLSQEM